MRRAMPSMCRVAIANAPNAGTEYLQFSPAAELKVVSETLMRNLQRLQEQSGAPA